LKTFLRGFENGYLSETSFNQSITHVGDRFSDPVFRSPIRAGKREAMV